MKTIQTLIAARMRYVVALNALFVLFAMPLWAQNKDMAGKHTRVIITIVTIKPDMRMDFENLIKNDYNAGIAKGGGKWSDVWVTATFGNAFDYVFVAPIDGYAQFDDISPLMKGLGKDAAAAFYAKAGKMVTNVHGFAYDVREDLSYDTKMAGSPKLAVVTFTSIAPGRTNEYEEFIKNEVLPVVKKSDIGGWFIQKMAFGGDVNEYVTIAMHENFAELEKGPPTMRVLGQEGAMKLMQKLPSGVVMHQERIVARYVPDLSYRPAASIQK